MDSSNNNHDHYHVNHDDKYDNYILLPLADDVNTNNNCNVNAIFSSSDDQSLQNSPAFANHNLPHAVIPSSTFTDQVQRNSEVATVVNDETTVSNVKRTKVGGTSRVKKRKREDAQSDSPRSSPNQTNDKNDRAIKFSIYSLQIGSWKRRQANHGEELVARCYFKKEKLAWEILLKEGPQKKLEFSFSDIDAINSVITSQEKGFLHVRLKNRPTFWQDVNQQPKRHAKWQHSGDFTDNQEATRTRVHKLEIAPSELRKYYNKIIEHNNELLELSRKKFPWHESPLFDDARRDPCINSMNNPFYTPPELPSNFRLPPQPPLATIQDYGINGIIANSSRHTDSGRNCPDDNTSNIYRNYDYPRRNYTVDEYPSQVYGSSNNHYHLGSTLPPLPALNYTVNADGRPQEWSTQAYPRLGTLPLSPPPLNEWNEPAQAHAHAHARFNDFNTNTSVDAMPLPLRYMEQHGSSYNNNQLHGQTSFNHDVGHVANQRRRSGNN